jgi:hypothetical protein
MTITPEDVERARAFYESYTAPEPSLTLMVLRGEFGPVSRDYLILRKAREYARDREQRLSQRQGSA